MQKIEFLKKVIIITKYKSCILVGTAGDCEIYWCYILLCSGIRESLVNSSTKNVCDGTKRWILFCINYLPVFY
jgi:hypothetical protein